MRMIETSERTPTELKKFSGYPAHHDQWCCRHSHDAKVHPKFHLRSDPDQPGVNIRHGKTINILSRMFVRDLMTRDVLPIAEEMPFKKILETVSYSRHLYYPAVNSEGDMTEIISFSNVRDAAQQGDTVETAQARDSRKVIGMLRRSDLQAVYNRAILVRELKT